MDTELLEAMLGWYIGSSDDEVSKLIRGLIENETDIEEVGVALEMLRSNVNEALTNFTKFYDSRPESFKDFAVKVGDYKVEWEYIGEGAYDGYDWTDLKDYPHLRANLSWKGKPCVDGSYCTFASTTTPHKELVKASKELVRDVIKAGGANSTNEKLSSISEVDFPRKVMERWTWRKYE